MARDGECWDSHCRAENYSSGLFPGVMLLRQLWREEDGGFSPGPPIPSRTWDVVFDSGGRTDPGRGPKYCGDQGVSY